jgi:choline kinase
LTPANEHKQLIVIDFEYASANVPGLEFANHFVRTLLSRFNRCIPTKIDQTEWCYNYHDPSKPHALNERLYPAPEEQRRFLKAYVQHRSSTSQAQTPAMNRSNSATSFNLDSYMPPGAISEDDGARERSTEAEIERLMEETRLWRIANSAQWVAWGIVQAKIEGMDESPEVHENQADDHGELNMAHESNLGSEGEANGAKADEEEDEDEEEGFDYLAYAQERALLFWGDVLQLGLVKKEDLPAELVQKVKIVEY